MQFIVQAKKNPKDGVIKYYAAAAPVTPMYLNQVAKQVAFATTVSSADIKAVLDALQHVILEAVKDGRSVRLGDLGTFRATISSKGQATREEVTANDIKAVRCQFLASPEMRAALQPTEVKFSKAKTVPEEVTTT